MGPGSTSDSTVYGPVKSWRLGLSLGIDLLFINSICSFRCIYCQLGKINVHTATRRVFVSTERVMSDLKASDWQAAEVITFSGSGEPALAANLGEVIHEVKAFSRKPVAVLTNSAHLNDAQVRRDLREADKVFCKLDAADDRTLRLINRPVEGVTALSLVEGVKAFRAEYPGHLAIQMMIMPANRREIERLAGLLKEIGPDEAQLNTPLRPAPREWIVEARGNDQSLPCPATRLRMIDRAEARSIEAELRRLTGLNIACAYRE